MSANFATLQSAAEDTGRQLIYSWVEDGRTAASDLAPEQFPNAVLATIAEAVAWASDQGIRGMADILAECFMDSPEGIQPAFIDCCEGYRPPSPEHCSPLVESLRAFHVERRKREIGDRIRQAIERGDEIDGFLAELATLEAGAHTRESLRERAYALRFDPAKPPPPDETCMMIGDVPIAARGNLTAIQGKSKVGKSAIVSAVIGAGQRGLYQTQGDTLCMSWTCDSGGAIVHLDSEQSRADWHGLVCRSVTRSGLAEASPRLVSLPLVMFNRAERLEILRQTMAFEHERAGVDLVVIDGIADLCASPNDEGEALGVVAEVMALAQKFHAAVFCVLHENPGSEIGKTRGHLGSELNRKAFANLRVDKDAETAVSTIWGMDMRKRDIPREQGFCFAWDDGAAMHTFQGRQSGLKAAKREAEAFAKAWAEWEPVFEIAPASGTNGTCPAVSVDQAAELLRDISGTDKPISRAAAKKRLQRAEGIGVLRKIDGNTWALNHAGHAGQMRDNQTLSP